MDPVALDFETRSTVDLPRHGGHRYAASPDSEVLCLVARVPGEGDGLAALATYYAWSPLPVAFTAYWPEAVVNPASRITFNTPAPPDELFAECARRGVVAHNAEGFDRLVWEALGWPEVTWYDSAPRARRAALPGSLDSLGNALDVGGKDAAGAGAMRQFSAPQRIGTGAIDEVVRGLRALKKGLPLRRPVPVRLLRALAPGVAVPDPVVWDAAYEPLIASPPYGAEVFLDPDPAQLAAIVRYCARDVWILAESWRLARLGEPHPDDDVLALDGVVNRRGICVDLGLVGKLRAEAERIRAEAVAAATSATAGQVTDTTLHSPSALCAWLRKKGYLVPNAQEKAIKAALTGAIDRGDKAAEAVCRARLRVARVSAGKLAAIDDRVCADGRLRGMFSYYGAHTGRWAGRGVQLQNLPRPHDTVTPAAADIAAGQGLAVAADTIRAVYGDKAADLDEPRLIGSLIRSCLVASPGKWLCYVDYSAIEARGLLWLAEDEAGLDVYRTGGDPYKVLAAAIYGVDLGAVTKPQRQAGKVGVLACLAAGTPVLTPLGFKPIEQITLDDKVWDGVEWVSHAGLVDRGERECVELEGVWLTPDHLVLTPTGWCPAGELVAGRCSMSAATTSSRGASAGSAEPPRSPTFGAGLPAAALIARRSSPHEPGSWRPTGSESYQILSFDGPGRTGSSPRSPAANGQAPGTTGTTEAAGSEFTPPGSPIPPSSSATSPPSRGGLPCSPSTGSTTTAATSRETSASPLRPSKCATPAPIVGAVTSPSVSGAGESSGRTSRGGDTAASPVPGAPRTTPTDARRRVYDLASAGPRNRFQAGGLIVHNCGFGGGPKAVARMALKGGIDLAAARTTPAAVVEAWRAKHPHVAGWPVPNGYGGVKTRVDEDGEPRVVRRGGLWKDLERYAKIALDEPTSPYGQTYFHRDGPDLICTLPSGRPIVYRKAQRERVERNGESRMALTYADPRYGRKVLYGGLLAENATQALCRDLLAAAMLRLEARGFPVVGHVHDEGVVEINDPAQKAEVEAIMLDSPPWAAGLPLAVEGVVNRRYGK